MSLRQPAVPLEEPVVPVARPADPVPRPAVPARKAALPVARQQQARADAERALAMVWERFQAGVAGRDAARRLGNADAWEAELRARLADEELINIDVRDRFESCIVQLLSNGWRRGHEALFPAAMSVFGWTAAREESVTRRWVYGMLAFAALTGDPGTRRARRASTLNRTSFRRRR